MNVAEDLDYGRRASVKGRVGIIKAEPLCLSTRRIEKEGRLTLYPKLARGFAGYLLHATKSIGNGITYKFGNHGIPKKNSIH